MIQKALPNDFERQKLSVAWLLKHGLALKLHNVPICLFVMNVHVFGVVVEFVGSNVLLDKFVDFSSLHLAIPIWENKVGRE